MKQKRYLLTNRNTCLKLEYTANAIFSSSQLPSEDSAFNQPPPHKACILNFGVI